MKSFIKLKKLILPEFADTSLLSQNEVGGQNDYFSPLSLSSSVFLGPDPLLASFYPGTQRRH